MVDAFCLLYNRKSRMSINNIRYSYFIEFHFYMSFKLCSNNILKKRHQRKNTSWTAFKLKKVLIGLNMKFFFSWKPTSYCYTYLTGPFRKNCWSIYRFEPLVGGSFFIPKRTLGKCLQKIPLASHVQSLWCIIYGRKHRQRLHQTIFFP